MSNLQCLTCNALQRNYTDSSRQYIDCRNPTPRGSLLFGMFWHEKAEKEDHLWKMHSLLWCFTPSGYVIHSGFLVGKIPTWWVVFFKEGRVCMRVYACVCVCVCVVVCVKNVLRKKYPLGGWCFSRRVLLFPPIQPVT